MYILSLKWPLSDQQNHFLVFFPSSRLRLEIVGLKNIISTSFFELFPWARFIYLRNLSSPTISVCSTWAFHKSLPTVSSMIITVKEGSTKATKHGCVLVQTLLSILCPVIILLLLKIHSAFLARTNITRATRRPSTVMRCFWFSSLKISNDRTKSI